MAGTIASAGNTHWTTPLDVLGLIHKCTPFIDLDPCNNTNSLVNARNTFTLPIDSLFMDWTRFRSVFLNPPWGTSYLSPDKKTCYSAKEYTEMKKADPTSVVGFHKQVLKQWVQKAVDTYREWDIIAANTKELYLLIPDQRSASHWHTLIFPYARAICTFKGRVAYGNGTEKKSSPSIGSVLVYFGDYTEKFKSEFESAGHHVEVL